MLFLSKETSNKDVNLKTQIMIAVKEDKAESSTEHIWKEKGFFKDQRNDLTIGKASFPENTLVYVNNGSIMPVKGVHAIILNLSYEGKFCQWQIHHQALIWTSMIIRIMRSSSLRHLLIEKMAYTKVSQKIGLHNFEG